MARIQRAGERCCSRAIGSPYRQTSRVIYQSPDLHKIEEHSRIYGLWTRRIVIAVCESFENFGWEIQPWAMIRGDIAPVSNLPLTKSPISCQYQLTCCDILQVVEVEVAQVLGLL